VTNLPNNFDRETYWQSIYRQPVADWLPALEQIRRQHHLPAGEWTRFALGRNLVFAYGELVLKLSQPNWAFEIPREADALTFVHQQLPVATPELLAIGEVEGWAYLIQRRLPGEMMRSRWAELSDAVKLALAHQQGEIMAALHALPLHHAPTSLAFDWTEMLTEQKAECLAEMQNAGVPEALLADLSPYLAAAEPLIGADGPTVLLHGDLDAINLLIEEQNGTWRITGLVDWGDIKLGPAAHDFISPGIHSYRGQRELLHAWYAGYGLDDEQRSSQFVQTVMARSMLYYAGEFTRYLKLAPGAEQCQAWRCVAACFWHLARERPTDG
jgi:hygromycin-B 7''-O-kinase